MKYPYTIGVITELLSGETESYQMELQREEAALRETAQSFEKKNYQFQIKDRYFEKPEGLFVEREIVGTKLREMENGKAADGIRIGFRIPTGRKKKDSLRFCVPSMIYTKTGEKWKNRKNTFMEDRLTGPMVLVYEGETGGYLQLSKVNPSCLAEEAIREKGENRYLKKTHNISLGYGLGEDDEVYFESFWPYSEEDRSAALNSGECPVFAFYPLAEERFEVKLVYCLEEGNCDSFAKTVYEAYERVSGRMEQNGQKTVELPFSKEEGRQYRIYSLGKSYREFEKEGAGFFFHFDPKYGYDSRPSGFSTCYDTIPHNSYTHILEYGFTGRQINAAYIMATEQGGIWLERGERVIHFFLKNCQLENGWVYSLYDLNTGKPFYSFGDPDAPKLHYISRTDKKGNYLRTMTEPMNDLLECYNWYKARGRVHEEWKESILRYADFLVGHQNEDGSWFRAYCPNGEGTDSIDRPDLTGPEALRGQKSVTSIPLVFLSNVCRMLRSENCSDEKYYQAVCLAGDYVLRDMVAEEHYQGATLDNPNQVDKEAAQYVMAGLCQLYLLTKQEKYLSGAENAAYIFTTWNYIWNAPMCKGNILYEKGFCTKGMGAINSVWGGGVVDIYSLFHIRELYLIGKLKNHPFMCRMAEWIASATAQILSWPNDDMGFADIGMQPEGFGICPQGADEGMIRKGGIWGTLGWIYSAGIYGLENYLMQKEEL